MFSIGFVGAGQFAGQFTELFHKHPGVSAVHVTDVIPERATELVELQGLAGTYPTFEDMLASDASMFSTPSRSSPSVGRTGRS
jgi:predicted dehydrogenase